jgi:hypothetical protein
MLDDELVLAIERLTRKSIHAELYLEDGFRLITGVPVAWIMDGELRQIVATVTIEQGTLECTSACHGDFDFHLADPDSLIRFEHWLHGLRPLGEALDEVDDIDWSEE